MSRMPFTIVASVILPDHKHFIWTLPPGNCDFSTETYHLVGAKEADPRNGKISNESPLGRALLGGRVNETVVAQTPNGELRLKILKIE